MRLCPRRESPGTGMGRHLKSARQGITKVGGYASLNKYVFSWLLNRSIVCSDLTVCGSLFHSAGAATAKPCLPMCFLGRTEETDSLLPRVRLLDRLKLKDMGAVKDGIDSLEYQEVILKKDTMLNWKPVEFFQKGCNTTHFVKSEDDAAKNILDSLWGKQVQHS